MPDHALAPKDLQTHAAFVRRLARSLVRDAHAADDLVQDTWAAALERPPRRAEARPWLARVTRNFARRRWRSESRRRARERDGARTETLPSAASGVVHAETLQRVVDAVRSLDEPYRATVLARYYEDLPPRAIAKRDGVPVDTVHTRLKRAHARLRTRLERDDRHGLPALGLLAGESPCLPIPDVTTLAPITMSIKALVVPVLGLAGIVGLWAVLTSDRGSGEEPGSLSARGESGARDVAAAASPADERTPVTGVTGARLSGRVLDEKDEPVVGAEVFVVAAEDPFDPDDPAPGVGLNRWTGRIFESDDEGRWQAVLPEPTRVHVALDNAPGYEEIPESAAERWVDAPRDGVDFRVQRQATASLEIRILEGAARRPLEEFSCLVRGNPDYRPEPGQPAHYTGGYSTMRGEGGVARHEVRVDPAVGKRVLVAITGPSSAIDEHLEQIVELQPGRTHDVVFFVPERGMVRGFVYDQEGAPIADAIVFFGPETRARGDEPFKPFQEKRITDGTRSAADGWFELAGDGALVTAWHPEFSGNTVETVHAGRIVLAGRGAVDGRLLRPDGSPAGGVSLWVDRRDSGIVVETDAQGRFALDALEAGAHALWREADELPMACFRLGANEVRTLELTVQEEGATGIELRTPDGRVPEELQGIAIGLESVFRIAEVENEGARLAISPPLGPGRFWLATRQGIATAFTVADGHQEARVEVGAAVLVVHADSRNNVQVVPADADAFTRLLAARVYVPIHAGQSFRFRLDPGSYLLVGEAGAVLAEVDVPEAGAEIRLE